MEQIMTDLRDHYVWQVNEAIAEDRMDLVEALNEEYVEESLRLILATACPPSRARRRAARSASTGPRPRVYRRWVTRSGRHVPSGASHAEHEQGRGQHPRR